MNNTKKIELIIEKTIYLDKTASIIYNKFAEKFSDKRIIEAFKEMANQESVHVTYWLKAKKIIENNDLYDIFKEPDIILKDLLFYENEFNKVLKNIENINESNQIIKCTINFEIYFLHQIFIKLINIIDIYDKTHGIKNEYFEHIHEMIGMIDTFGKLSEFKLAITTFKSTWKYAVELEELNFEKNKIFGVVAHDLLNPINSIKGLSELIRFSGDISNKHLNYTNHIIDRSEFMINLINDTLDISSIESGFIKLKKKYANLDELINKIIEHFIIITKKRNLTIIYNSSNIQNKINIDIMKIEQAIMNLISNAIKYSPDYNNIIIKTAWNEKSVSLSIQDFGVGIEESEQDNLFKPFGKTSSKTCDSQKSTGLGLSIVKKIIDLHGGKICFQSKKNIGSTFCFELPID